ncbi:hypothetical protein [Nonomuraea sp. B19D2]|uniref:hypothetical protein n=1 Tax=Nonomuraea sp. B19D2 TaxID=3159561 RepID=UPI0032D9E843
MKGRAWLRGALVSLAVLESMAGVWQLLCPRSFFDDFPAKGNAWVAALPPYNEHLLRDQGGMHLAMAVMFAAAAIAMERRLVNSALIANLVFAVPHAVFHATHLEVLSRFDAIAQTVTLLAAVLIPAGLLLLCRAVLERPKGSSPPA